MNNWVREWEWEDWFVVRKMSDLPNGWLEEINIIRENFPKNEILQKMEELYRRYFDLWDYQKALQVCILMIQREVKREILKWAQIWYNLKTWAYEVNFDTVSTPTALEWKQRTVEIQEMKN